MQTPAAHLELAAQAVDDDVQVELAHALNDGLVGLLVAREVEAGVLLRQLDQAVAHLLQVALALGLNRDLDDGVCDSASLSARPCDARAGAMPKGLSGRRHQFVHSPHGRVGRQ